MIVNRKRTRTQLNCCRCSFVHNFIKSQGLNYESAGKILNVSRAALWHAITVADDMHLSSIIKLIESQSYSCRLQLIRPGDSEFHFADNRDGASTNNMQKIILKRTTFIKLAFIRYGIPMYEGASRLNVAYSTLHYCLDKKDDIKLSRLYEICHTFNLNLIIDIFPNAIPKEEISSPIAIVRYNSMKYQEITTGDNDPFDDSRLTAK